MGKDQKGRKTQGQGVCDRMNDWLVLAELVELLEAGEWVGGVRR